ncbi:MAG: ABC transporter substrate-binding protein [Myxococcales bacterium]|nr:ABC transporter substrate-binding protein [Myxococcales bacterium]
MRRALLALLALVLALALGCSKSPGGGSAGGVERVKLALNWVPEPEFGGFYAARDSGAFAREKLEVDIQGGGAGVPVVQMVATGRAEFGIAGADEVLMARDKGALVVPLFATFQTSPQGLMAHASRGATGIGDLLKDGVLAIEPGLPYAAFLKKKYGAFTAKVVPYDGGVARFVADPSVAQQCYVTSEPIAAKKQGSDPRVFLVADEGFNPYVGVVITSAETARNKPELVRAFVRAVRAGWASYLAEPGPTNRVMAALNGAMDAETFAAAAAAQKPLIVGGDAVDRGVGAMTKERWETLATQLAELGVLGTAAPVDFLVAVD